MSPIERLRCFVVGNDEYISRHLLPTSEPLKMQRIYVTFVLRECADPVLPKCAYVRANHS